MWLQMRIWVTHGCLFITWLMPAVHWPQQRQLTPQLFQTQRAGTDAFNNSTFPSTQKLQDADFGCFLRHGPFVHPLSPKQSGGSSWPERIVMKPMCWITFDCGRPSACWDDGTFILAAMNYWSVESAASRTGVCTCVWARACVCVHTCVIKPAGRLPNAPSYVDLTHVLF